MPRFAAATSDAMSPDAGADPVARDSPAGPPRAAALPGAARPGPASPDAAAAPVAAVAASAVAASGADAAPAGPTPTWRHDMAGGDKAFLKTLDRFDSPAALARAYRELTAKLSSGELRAMRGPPDTATPEQVAAWRTQHGLPDSAAAYVEGLTLPGGDVMGEAERPLLAAFADEALKGHWTAAQYNQAVGWYFALQDRMARERQHADADFKARAVSDLMRDWGSDYAANRNAVGQFFDKTFPTALRNEVLNARLPDGTLLANHPAFNQAILAVAKTLDPRGAMLPAAAGAGPSGLETRIAEIEGRYLRAPRGSDAWKTYWSGDTGARMQQEYRGLLAAREQARRG